MVLLSFITAARSSSGAGDVFIFRTDARRLLKNGSARLALRKSPCGQVLRTAQSWTQLARCSLRSAARHVAAALEGDQLFSTASALHLLLCFVAVDW